MAEPIRYAPGIIPDGHALPLFLADELHRIAAAYQYDDIAALQAKVAELEARIEALEAAP